jgi:hypothetical protein
MNNLNVKLKAKVKVAGEWKDPGSIVELSNVEARRLLDIGAAEATGAESKAAPESEDLDAMRAELTRLQEFERQQLAAVQAQALAEKEEAERKAAEEAAAKAKTKAGAKGEADGQTNGK